ALLARNPQQNEAELLAYFEKTWPLVANQAVPQEIAHDWSRAARTIAVGNLLAKQHTQGFTSSLIKQLDLDLHVTVMSASDKAEVPAMIITLAPLEVPPGGLPATPRYRLVHAKSFATRLGAFDAGPMVTLA